MGCVAFRKWHQLCQTLYQSHEGLEGSWHSLAQSPSSSAVGALAYSEGWGGDEMRSSLRKHFEK